MLAIAFSRLINFSAGLPVEFYVSSSTRPFESFNTLSSQFFPGQTLGDKWTELPKQLSENVTPDSGVEDGPDPKQPAARQVQTLKYLAHNAVKANQIREQCNRDTLGERELSQLLLELV